MAIIQAVLAVIFRSAGKILNTAFGWATAMLFGKVPEDRQIHLSIIAFGSVIWMVALLGSIFPRFATFLLAFVTLPDWINDNWIRLAFLIAAIVLPMIIGVVSYFMLEPQDRPKGLADKAKAVLKGYPYTFGLAITLIMMTVFAPIMKARTILKRWTSEHVPVIVESNDYMHVVRDIQQALKRGGVPTRREQASWMLRFPTKLLTFFAGGAIENLVADKLTTLKSDKVEVLLHPSDLIISGKEMDAAHAHAVITEQLTFTKAYMTWTKEAHEIEDRLRSIWESLQARADGFSGAAEIERLHGVERDLRKLEVPYEEWETLFRSKLLVERGLLQTMAGLTDKPRDLTEASPEEVGVGKIAANGEDRPASSPVKTAATLALGGLLAWRMRSRSKDDDHHMDEPPPPDFTARDGGAYHGEQ